MALENRRRRALLSTGRHVEPTMITCFPAEAKRGRRKFLRPRNGPENTSAAQIKFNFPTRGGEVNVVKSGTMEAVTKIETRSQTPRLGLVCITHTDAVRYKTVTRKRLLQFDAV